MWIQICYEILKNKNVLWGMSSPWVLQLFFGYYSCRNSGIFKYWSGIYCYHRDKQGNDLVAELDKRVNKEVGEQQVI